MASVKYVVKKTYLIRIKIKWIRSPVQCNSFKSYCFFLQIGYYLGKENWRLVFAPVKFSVKRKRWLFNLFVDLSYPWPFRSDPGESGFDRSVLIFFSFSESSLESWKRSSEPHSLSAAPSTAAILMTSSTILTTGPLSAPLLKYRRVHAVLAAASWMLDWKLNAVTSNL